MIIDIRVENPPHDAIPNGIREMDGLVCWFHSNIS